MKTYFAKYLPVEGEIKEGDSCIETYLINPKIVIVTKIIDGDTYKTSGSDTLYHLKGALKKVKLFLCSRDIQVGDKVWSDFDGFLGEGKYEKIEDNYSYFINPQGEEIMLLTREEVPTHNFFKVIGEISPEATWVKESDKFDETEAMQTWEECGRLILLPVGQDYPEEKRLSHRKLYYIQIKGPCGHFH